MRLSSNVALLAAVVIIGDPALAMPRTLRARVEPRVELMSIIFRLAGNPEYNQPNSKSPYADEVEAHFGRFRDHDAVQAARRLRSRRGVSYDAVMSMAMHVTDPFFLRERIPFDESPPRLDKRWHADEARDFLEKARDFVEQTRFDEFVKAHHELYAAAGKRLTEQLAKRDYVAWFDEYFGARSGARFEVIVGMLNGGGNYGVGIRYAGGREVISPVIGAYRFDDEGIPVFSDDIVSTIVHEFCHSYTNQLVDKHADRLEPAGTRMFAHCEQTMRDMAYGNWTTMMYESLVRACVVRHIHALDGEDAGRDAIRYEQGRGFRWVGELSELLVEYETQRDRYSDLDAFMPRVVEFFNEYADTYEQQMSRAPKVIAMTPANGATDVDPNLKEIRITFDRPMRDGNWSVVGGGPHYPETTGKPRYDQECRVLTLPVKLKPGWSYQFWLNRGKYNSFQSQDGVRLESVAVTFETSGEAVDGPPRPKVVAMIPANGSNDVDPGLTDMKITFDRPMKDGCWAVVGGGPHFPDITGKLSYDAEFKVLTIPVKLKPDWSYQLWLNRGKFNSFQSQDGVRLESVAVTFKTRAE